MSKDIPKDKIKGYECKHAVYRAYKPQPWEHGRKASDVVLVKENIHLTDDTVETNIRLIHNYKRDFYVTKPGFQTHKDKKEWELETRCIKKSCTQVNLTNEIALSFGRHSNHLPLRKLAASPYLYGCDVTTPVLIKHHYKTKWPECISKSSVAVLDIETDVVWGTEEIISISLTFRDKAVIAVTKKFLGTIANPGDKIQAAFTKYLGKEITARNLKLEVLICDTPGEMAKRIFDYAHAWRPDFVSIWNIAFDLPKIITALENEGYDLGDVFSDPCVPKEYRTAKFIMDSAIKVTQSGKSTPKHPADLWHTMDCLASFYLIDSMATYKKIRAAKGNEPSYSLDFILNKILKIGKLDIEGVGGNHTLAWHIEMQRDYKIEYLIYNIFDCVSVEMLDEKTNDLAIAVSQICNYSEFRRFPSIPRRTVDNLHFFCKERGLVIGTTSNEMTDDNDLEVVGMGDWIGNVLSSYLIMFDKGISNRRVT